jgi:5-methylthioadenosine/S-adenosylhomocysteine deaminase
LAEFDLLLVAKLVVPDARSEPLSPGFVAIRDSKIELVGEGEPAGITARESVVAQDGIIIPGLVSTHDHMYGVLAHGIPVDREIKGFRGFLEDFWWPRVEDRIDPGLLRSAVEAAAVERLCTGTTCISDILEAPNAIPGALVTEAQVLEQAGLRAVLSFEATERISRENGERGLEENSSFISRRKSGGLTKGMHCVHTTFTCSPAFLRRCREQADATGSGIQIHLEESPYEADYALKKYHKLPVEIYNEVGFWGPDVIASQCVQTTPEEIDILAKHHVKISHQPLSNGEVGGGIAPVPRMIGNGLELGLGTDGFIVDMFEVMRAAWLLHKAASADPNVLTASQVFKMATETGAGILKTGAGALRPGLKADLVVLDDRFPTPITMENAVTQIVVYGSGNLVRDVVVDGKVVVKSRSAVNVDAEAARQGCVQAARNLWSRTAHQRKTRPQSTKD